MPGFAEPEPPCRVLVTTRNIITVPRADVVPVGQFSTEAATRLLAPWARIARPTTLRRRQPWSRRKCGHLPLAVGVCGALINARNRDWSRLLGLLRQADLDALPSRLEDFTRT